MKLFAIVSIMVLSLLFTTAERNAFSGEPAKKAEAKPALTGKVVETMDSGRYTYICLEKNGKKTWAAVYKTKVAVGQNISLKPGIEMANFESTTLHRKFDKIYFSEGQIDQKGAGGKVKSRGPVNHKGVSEKEMSK